MLAGNKCWHCAAHDLIVRTCCPEICTVPGLGKGMRPEKACCRTVSHPCCVCAQYPLALQLMASGRVDVLPLITHRFGFSAEGVRRGFDTAARAAETKAIKVMFDMQTAG